MLMPTIVVGTCAMVLIALMYMSIYPSFQRDANDFADLIGRLPEAARKGLNVNATVMLSFLGFYAFTFTLIGLAAGIMAVSIGLGLFSREDSSGTTDFLLSKPRKRSSIWLQKYVAGIVALLTSSVLYTTSAYIIAHAVNAGMFDVDKYLLLNLSLLISQLWLYHFAILITQLRRIRSVVSSALGITFSFFVIGMIGAIIGDEKMRYLSPLKFFDVIKIAGDGSFETKFVIYALTTLALMGVISFVIYTRKDVRAAI